MSTFNNTFLAPVIDQTLRKREFAISFVLTVIEEVSDTYKVHYNDIS